MSRTFGTTSDYLEIGSALVTTYPFTVACWFYSTNNTALQNLFAICDSALNTNQQWRLQLRGDVAGDPLRVISRTTSQVNADTTIGYSLNTWQHACGVFASATDRRVFLDGGNKGTNTTSNTPTGLNKTSIGLVRDSTPDSPMIGRIAEVVVWNIALSDAIVAMLAQRVHPYRIYPANIIAYWPIFGNSSPEVDLSGGGLNLTVVGTTLSDHPPVSPLFGFDMGWMGAYSVVAGGGLSIPVAMKHYRDMRV